MKLEKWFAQKLEEFKDDVEFRTEEVILEITERIVELMKEENINRTELAKRLGVSKPFVSKLLNGNPNMRLKTMVSLSMALKYDLKVSFTRKLSMRSDINASSPDAVPAAWKSPFSKRSLLAHVGSNSASMAA